MPISKINTTSITDNSVTAGKIVAGAVDADIAAGSIDTAQIADDAVTTAKIPDDAVTTAKIPDDAVTSAKLDTNITIAGTLDVDGSQITVGSSGSRFAENNLSFNASGASYIDHSTVGQNINFRMSNSSSLDTTAMILEPTQLYVSGNLGVGTSTPDTKVQIKGGINSAQLILGGTDGRGLKVSTSNPGGQNDCGVNYDAQDTEGGGLGHHAFLVAGTERMRVCKTGTISLGKVNTPDTTILMTMGGNGTHHQHTWKVGPHYTADNPSFYTINESGTGVYLPHGNTAWAAHSDERIKENITPLGNVLSDVMDMRCVKYNLKSGDPSQTKIGFIAQDWQSSFPEVVDEDQNTVIESDGTIGPIEESESTDVVKAIAYTETIPVLLKAIQEQQALIVTLTTRITALEDA